MTARVGGAPAVAPARSRSARTRNTRGTRRPPQHAKQPDTERRQAQQPRRDHALPQRSDRAEIAITFADDTKSSISTYSSG